MFGIRYAICCTFPVDIGAVFISNVIVRPPEFEDHEIFKSYLIASPRDLEPRSKVPRQPIFDDPARGI